MDGLRIEIELATPMVLPAMPIHLDALLAYAVTEDALSVLGDDGLGEGEVRALAEPAMESVLEKSVRDGEWVWKASALMPEDIGDSYLRMWTRKTDPYDLAERMGEGQISTRTKFPLKPFALKVDTVRGLLKNHFNFYPVREVGKLVAWCVGDGEAIHDLLDAHIHHIGHRRRMGHGKVRSIRVVEDTTAEDRWKMRVLPWQEEGYLPMQAAFRPPYWAIENRRAAYCPPAILG